MGFGHAGTRLSRFSLQPPISGFSPIKPSAVPISRSAGFGRHGTPQGNTYLPSVVHVLNLLGF